jgi:hypothetical protein
MPEISTKQARLNRILTPRPAVNRQKWVTCQGSQMIHRQIIKRGKE